MNITDFLTYLKAIKAILEKRRFITSFNYNQMLLETGRKSPHDCDFSENWIIEVTGTYYSPEDGYEQYKNIYIQKLTNCDPAAIKLTKKAIMLMERKHSEEKGIKDLKINFGPY